jgi:hypothetical protein
MSHIELFRELYSPILSSLSIIETGDNLIRIRVNGREKEVSSLLETLPEKFLAGLVKYQGIDSSPTKYRQAAVKISFSL